MASTSEDADLAPSRAEGYNLSEKKTVEEYTSLDANDESLKRWKESLGLSGDVVPSDPNDPRKVIVEELALEVPGRPDVVLNLRSPGALDTLKEKTFVIKEGAEYRMKVKFRIQHEVITGLRYIQVVKRHGVKVDRMEEMLGSYAPGQTQQKKFPIEEAPSGFMARAKYTARSIFSDDDNQKYLDFTWTFEIKKSWD